MWNREAEITRQARKDYREFLSKEYPVFKQEEARGIRCLDVLDGCCAIEQLAAEKRGVA